MTQANEYCVVVQATNTATSDAQLVGWLDYDADGSFSAAERSLPGAPGACPNGQVDIGTGSCTFTTGNVPASSGTQNYVLVFTDLGDIDLQTAAQTHLRLRLTSDPSFFSDTSPSPGGAVADGEIEDHLVNFSTLPVSLSSVLSRLESGRLSLDWSSSSELFNIGYQLWGLDAADTKWKKLHGWLIRSGSGNAVEEQRYSKTLSIPAGIDQLAAIGISSVDSDGSEHYYGPFEIGKTYGQLNALEPIAWNHVRREVDARMAARGYAKHRMHGYYRVTADTAPSVADVQQVVEFQTREPGLYRITAHQLAGTGADWTAIEKRDIALVDARGNAVVRYVAARGAGRGQTRMLGELGEIYFHASAIDPTAGLYTDNRVYRLVVDPRRSLNAQYQAKQGIADNYSAFYHEQSIVERDNQYNLASAVDDPWLDQVVLSYPDQTGTYASAIPVEADAMWGEASLLTLGLGRSSELAAVDQDEDGVQDVEHRVEAVVLSPNGTGGLLSIGTESASGRGEWTVDFSIAGNTPLTLLDGQVVVGGLFKPGPGYAFSEVQVDSVSLIYARPYVAKSGEQHLGFQAPADGAPGYQVTLPESGYALVFAHLNGNLVRVAHESQHRVYSQSGGTKRVVRFAALKGSAIAATPVKYWVGGKSAMREVESLSVRSIPSAASLLKESADSDFLIIAHPAFMTADLSGYADFKRRMGFHVTTVNYLDIVDAFGGGQPGPAALSKYLGAVEAAYRKLEHVLLVGGSSYDHTDKLGVGSITFIPGHYGKTPYSNYTVTDTPYVTGADKRLFASVGRWPVRNTADLHAVINNSMAWSDMDHSPGSALVIAENTVAGEGIDFAATLNSVAGQLPDSWTMNKVYVDEIQSTNKRLSATQALVQARSQIISGLEAGPDVVLYNGHGTTSQLSNRGLFKAADVAGVNGRGAQLWMPLSCYMTYYESTHVNTLAHQLMFSGRAAGITGAMLLSDQAENTAAGHSILNAMVNENQRIGDAISEYKARSGIPGMNINWALLGDPTQLIRSRP